MTKLKDLLLENPDTLTLKREDGTKRYIGYGGESNAVTGIIFSDPLRGVKDNYVALMDDPELGQKAVVQLHDKDLNERGTQFFFKPSTWIDHWDDVVKKRVIIDVFSGGSKGHGHLEDFIAHMFGGLYNTVKDGTADYSHYDETWRFRIFNVDAKRYFTIWSSSIDLYRRNLPLFIEIVKACGFDPNTMIWEIKTDEMGDDRVKLLSMAELNNLLGMKTDEPETQSEIQKRISELSKKLSEMESDEHVKGATWSQSEKRRHKIDMINIKAELDALGAAAKSGEKEIKNVIIKTIDNLADDEGDVIPADILYAELEKKLSHYGTSAVAIIRALRDRGIDIKKALREINEKFGGKTTATELLSELSKYMNEKCEPNEMNENEETALVQPGTISRFKETATTPEAFLRIFKGHTLGDLLDKLSFCRLYVMNKFGDMRGDDPQQRFVWMLDHALAYVNYRLIMPLRQKVDDEDKEDQAKPEVIAHRQKKAEILKQAFAAQRHGDHDRASKLRQLHRDMEEPNTRYSANMKHMKAEVDKIHSTPLSLEELSPPKSTDSERDKKNYEHYVEAFNQFKSN